ncbi:MAG TPA: hypothetical protein VFB06_00690 [Streptosporangiaceae bacterium]|nr:hypothetical protein [Streptosporangiaceae bacterium]
MWLIVAQDGDADARWLAGRLRARANRRVELIEAGELVHDCRWEHRIGTTVTASRLALGSGTVIDCGEVDGVLNRLSWLTAEGFEGAPRRDRDYASSELFALGMSWLESMGPRVLNQPAGFSLDGSWRTSAHWRALASSVGLPVVPYDSDHPDDGPHEAGRTVLVVDGRVIGSPATPHDDRLVALQRACGLDIVEVCFGPGGAVSGVSFLPALRRYGQACVRAVLAALPRRAVLKPAGLS